MKPNPEITLQAYRPAVCSDRPGNVHLLVRLTAPWMQNPKKPRLNLGLSIDRSGSMGGQPIECAREAAAYLVRRLDPSDRISVVTFGTSVDVLTPCREVGQPQDMIRRLQEIEVEGFTALHQGWLEACYQVERGLDDQRINRVILLSDGQANEGLVDPLRIEAQVSEWERQGITTTTVGLGLDYNEDLLAAMARAGNGNFYHVQNAADIEAYFGLELQGLTRTFGRSVSLGIEALNGVEVLRVLNPVDRTPRGRLKLSDLVHGKPLEVVLELLVPAQKEVQDLCRFRLAWTDVANGMRLHTHSNFCLPVVPHGQLSEFPVCVEVLQKRAVQLAGQTLKEAVAAIDRKDYPVAQVHLQSGLDSLAEAQPSAELQDLQAKLEKLMHSLKSGAYTSVRKEAVSSSQSIGSCSITLNPGLKAFLALPPEQRDPKKLMEILGLPPQS